MDVASILAVGGEDGTLPISFVGGLDVKLELGNLVCTITRGDWVTFEFQVFCSCLRFGYCWDNSNARHLLILEGLAPLLLPFTVPDSQTL